MSPILHGHASGRRQLPALVAHPAPRDLLRHWLSQTLRSASAMLARHAREVARPLHARQRRPPAEDPVIEFYAEAGAPEGALFVDGQYLGRLDVDRL
jgi:hypothetical protein